MAIPWDSIRSLLLFFGPLLLPKAIGYYRALRAAPKIHGISVQPVPPPVRVALVLLFSLSVGCLVKTLPVFAPENVFKATQSRLQIPVDVLFNRVAAGRPEGILTTRDENLRARFVNLESRLLYFQFGPEVLADCPFCLADDPRSYLYYALPSMLWPHIANLIAVAVVTSPTLTGKYGGQWRTVATTASAVLAALEVYLVVSYNYQINARAKRLEEIDFFFWTMRVYRLVALAIMNGVLGWLLYLSSTNRAFVQLPSPTERIDSVARSLAAMRSKLSALGIVKNTALRDEDLRSRSHAYWAHEVRLMQEVMEEREVIEGVTDALSKRIDIQTITRDAEAYAQGVLGPVAAECI